MMGRMTLREVRKALAAARGKGTKRSTSSPTVEELESLARVLERQVKATSTASPTTGVPAEEPAAKQAAEQGAAADGGGRGGSRRSARSRGPRRR
jgi:hypothetical protein